MKNCTAFALTLSWWICVPVPSLAASYTFTWLGGLGSEGYAINNLGQVVGVSTDMGFPCLFVGGTAQPVVDWEGEALGINQYFGAEAFAYINGIMHDLGPGYAYGINESGQVVGESRGGAFLYSGGSMYLLADLVPIRQFLSLYYGAAINDVGQITGLGDPGGSVQAFLLTPIPEPSSLVIAALGLIGLAAWGWRRKRSA